MRLTFRKYHGLGNDFVMLDRRSGGTALSPVSVRALCDRHRGVGADGVLSLWPDPTCTGRMQIQNADGSEALMCGNGLRCMARFVHDLGISTARTTTFRIGERVYTIERLFEDRYKVDMGKPLFEHADLPAPGTTIAFAGRDLQGTRCWLGNPHWVLFADSLAGEDPLAFLHRHGAALSRHPAFASGCNVSVASPMGSGFGALVYERGVGLTQACGSGATAIGVAAVQERRSKADTPIRVALPGGELIIRVHANGSAAMEGEAQFVYEGHVEIAAC